MDELIPPRRPRTSARPRTRPVVRSPGGVAKPDRVLPKGPFLGKRAIIIGGSVTGLLAARVLADFFEKVVIVERDYLYDRPIGRKGAPQARHSHILLAAGAAVIGELLPEILEDMAAAGAVADQEEPAALVALAEALGRERDYTALQVIRAALKRARDRAASTLP